jgi:ATP-binding cassette, subfamily B, bacterial PglK
MLATIGKLLALLDRGERIQLALLFGAVLVMAFLEAVGIAAVLPFLSLAADPSQLQTNPWLARAYEAFGFTSATGFLIALGAFAVAALVLSNAWMMVTAWAQWRFAFGRMHTLGVRLLRHYSAQPYIFFLRRNSADCGKNVLDEVEDVAIDGLMPALRLLARGAVALAIIALLVAFDPGLALLVALTLGGAYAGIYIVLQHSLTRLGSERLTANTGRYKAASEFFGAIKEVKLLGREDAFVGAFTRHSARFARRRASAQIIGEMPRYVLESLAFGGVLLSAIYLLARGGSLTQVIPVLGLYAFAGYRLLPSLQQVYGALTLIRFGTAAVNNLHKEFTSRPAVPQAPSIMSANGSSSIGSPSPIRGLASRPSTTSR